VGVVVVKTSAFCEVMLRFLGAFAKLREATKLILLPCLTIRMEQLGSLWTNFLKSDI
jgi:hypothetical protein